MTMPRRVLAWFPLLSFLLAIIFSLAWFASLRQDGGHFNSTNRAIGFVMVREYLGPQSPSNPYFHLVTSIEYDFVVEQGILFIRRVEKRGALNALLDPAMKLAPTIFEIGVVQPRHPDAGSISTVFFDTSPTGPHSGLWRVGIPVPLVLLLLYISPLRWLRRQASIQRKTAANARETQPAPLPTPAHS